MAATAACALALAGCGGSEEPEGSKLPESTVAELDRRLDEIQRRYDDARENDNPGACVDIQSDSFPAVKRLLDGLPEDVDPKVRDASVESFAHLQDLTDQGCKDIEEPAETETTPTEVPPETVPPETVPPETAPPETTPPETTPQEPAPPDNGSGGAVPEGGGDEGGTEAPEGGGARNGKNKSKGKGKN